jgi:hypothetical protein
LPSRLQRLYRCRIKFRTHTTTAQDCDTLINKAS